MAPMNPGKRCDKCHGNKSCSNINSDACDAAAGETPECNCGCCTNDIKDPDKKCRTIENHIINMQMDILNKTHAVAEMNRTVNELRKNGVKSNA